MAHKQLLHELLEEKQEPFHLKSYIADRRYKFNKSLPADTLQLGKRKPAVNPKTAPRLSNFCFFALNESPDVRNSPFVHFQSPAMSPCKSPISPVFLRVPPRTASLLVEAAMRIQKRQQSKPKVQVSILGFGLFGGFLRRLKDRSKNKKGSIGDKNVKISETSEAKLNEEMQRRIRTSRSCSNFRLTRFDTESCSYEQSEETINRQCSLRETLLCSSPFQFSLRRSASLSSGRCTPDFCSPVTSLTRHARQENANSDTRNPDNEQGDEEEKEHCSPVSVLDSFFEDDELEYEHEANEDDEQDDSSYANVQRVKQQLLTRLRRFEKLAELDPIELEKRFLESNSSDDDYQVESLSSKDDNETFLACRDEDEIRVELVKLPSLEHNWNRSCSATIWKKLKEVEFMELDLENESDGWRKFSEGREEVEAEIVGLLVEEVLEMCCCMDDRSSSGIQH